MTAIRQVGALFLLHGGWAGLDLFDSPATLGVVFPKLVNSWALEATHMDWCGNSGPHQSYVSPYTDYDPKWTDVTHVSWAPLTVLAKAREKARQTTCLSNQRQIAMAITTPAETKMPKCLMYLISV